jgi:hypothetical protein
VRGGTVMGAAMSSSLGRIRPLTQEGAGGPADGSACPDCGEWNPEDAEACFACGKALHMLTRGALLASRYVIRGHLGHGGMGHVYRAHDRLLEEDVAIKVLRAQLLRDADMARRFRSEIRLARRVSHVNVCRIHEYGEDGAVRFLSMEFVAGVDLKRLLRAGPLPSAEAFEVAIQAAEGLRAVHGLGIIHRDIKPSNLMVDRAGTVRLMDFGIAKEADAEAALTKSGQLMGTPEYMSPEQAHGAHVGYPADVYALGCVVYEAFAGIPPFRADTPFDTLRMHVQAPPPLDEDGGPPLPAALRETLRRCLAKDPAARHTAADLVEALRSARREEVIPPVPLAPLVAAQVAADDGAASSVRTPVDLSGRGVAVTTTLGRPGVRTGARVRARRRWQRLGVAGAGLLAVAATQLLIRPVGVAPLPPPPAAEPVAPAPVLAPDPRPVAAEEPTTGAPAPARRWVLTPPVQPTPAAGRPLPDDPVPVESRLPRPPAPASAPVLHGSLSLVIVPPAEVSVDGETLGIVSLRELALTAGPHALRIEHPDFKPLQRKVTVQAGVTETLVLDLSEKGVRRPRGPETP